MQKFTVLALCIAPVIAWGADADPCKGVKVKTDAFGTTAIGNIVYTGNGYLAVDIQKIGDERHLEMLFVRPGVLDVHVPPGTAGKVALGDGTTLQLTTSKDAPPVAGSVTSVFTQWVLTFPVSDDDLARLAASPITAVASTIAEQPAQFELKGKDSASLQQAAACILTKLEPATP